jgi:hypothetical protein
MLAVAFPLLFIIGISNGTKKKSNETVIERVSNTAQLSSKQIVGLYPNSDKPPLKSWISIKENVLERYAEMRQKRIAKAFYLQLHV